MESIGDRLRELRLAKGLSLEAAGAAAGTTKQSMSQIEKGQTKEPNGVALEAWSRLYGVNLRWLATGKGPKQSTNSESQSVRPSDEIMSQALDLLYLLADLRPDDRRFSRITWPMLMVAAKAITKHTDQRETVSMLLNDLKEIEDAPR